MRAAVAAWGLFTLSLLGNVIGMVVLASVPTEALERVGDSLWSSGSFVAVMVVFGLVGAVVAARLPANPVGWLFLGLAVMESATQVTYALAHYSTSVRALGGEAWIAGFSTWAGVVPPAVLTVTCLVFPDGRLLSPRWRWALGACLVLIGYVVLRRVTEPGPLPEFPAVTNPAGTTALDWMGVVPVDPIFPLALAIGVAALVVRFRRARGVERAQLKWFAWAASLMTAFLPVSFVVNAVADVGPGSRADTVAGLVFAALLCGLPISVGIAVLRYRLYDIDRLIRRTLVYGALTAVLLGTYLVLVLGLRELLTPLTGGSDLAVAASTLAAAGLFRPLRGRIQGGVDRRFYRGRYDAAATASSFARRLRQEVDLDTVRDDLCAVVRDTVQPTGVSLWLREVPR